MLELLSVGVQADGNRDEWQLTFTPGTGRARRAFVTAGDLSLFKRLEAALSYALCEDDQARERLNAVELRLTDEHEEQWTVGRGALPGSSEREAISLMRNGQPVGGASRASVAHLVRSATRGSGRLVGAYQVLPHEGVFLAQRYTALSSELIAAHNYLEDEASSTAARAAAIWGEAERPKAASTSGLAALSAELTPLYRRYQLLAEMVGKLARDVSFPSADTHRSLNTLKRQVELLRSIDELRARLVGFSPKRNQVLSEQEGLKQHVAENLRVCGLKEVPNEGAARNWSVGLECLCYLSVLDRMIPVLRESLDQVAQLDQDAREQVSRQSKDMAALKRDLLVEAKRYLKALRDPNLLQPNPPHFDLSGLSAFIGILAGRGSSDRELVKKLKIDELDAELSRLIGSLQVLPTTPTMQSEAPTALRAFLASSEDKSERLRTHWKQLATELGMSPEIQLNDYVDHVLRYNEVFLLQQKQEECTKRLKHYEEDAARLAEALEHWYQMSESQKSLPAVDDLQLLLQEATNIVRYLKTKEEKLALLEKNALRTEADALNRQRWTDEQVDIERNWAQIFARMGFPEIPISDARLERFLNRGIELTSLETLLSKSHHGEVFAIPSPKNPFEGVCLWYWHETLDGRAAPEMLHAARQAFEALPLSATHIFVVNSAETRAQLGEWGCGKAERRAFAIADTMPAPPPRVKAPVNEDAAIARTEKRAHDDAVPPRVQAVVDLLRGHATK